MQIFAIKMPFTVTSVTLLSPLLSPLNTLYIRYLSPMVTEVTVKSQKYSIGVYARMPILMS